MTERASSRLVEIPGENHLSEIEMEDFCFAKAGLRKDNVGVVAMSINGRGFCFELNDFIEFVATMANNAKRFVDISAAIQRKPDEKAN